MLKIDTMEVDRQENNTENYMGETSIQINKTFSKGYTDARILSCSEINKKYWKQPISIFKVFFFNYMTEVKDFR